MATVIVIARVKPKPETREEFLALLEEVQTASRGDEGCINYGYYAEITDPDSLVAVEEWKDMAALEGHLKQPHVEKLVAALPAMIAEPPTIVAHEVAFDGPLPLPG
jgi:quinol monooxygenase YgiN